MVNGFGSSMYVVLYSIEQQCFHIETLGDYLEKNNDAFKRKKQNGYFMVSGLFSSHKDASNEGIRLQQEMNPELKLETEQKLIKDFGQWHVYNWGICGDFNPYKIEGAGITDFYDIHKSRLWENNPDWISHLSEKNWVNIEEFKQALAFAKEYFKRGT